MRLAGVTSAWVCRSCPAPLPRSFSWWLYTARQETTGPQCDQHTQATLRAPSNPMTHMQSWCGVGGRIWPLGSRCPPCSCPRQSTTCPLNASAPNFGLLMGRQSRSVRSRHSVSWTIPARNEFPGSGERRRYTNVRSALPTLRKTPQHTNRCRTPLLPSVIINRSPNACTAGRHTLQPPVSGGAWDAILHKRSNQSSAHAQSAGPRERTTQRAAAPKEHGANHKICQRGTHGKMRADGACHCVYINVCV